MGKLVFYERQLFHVEKQTQENTQTRVQRYRQAKEQAVMQVQTLHKLALREISSENAAIFQAHHLLLEDQDFNGYVLELIKNQHRQPKPFTGCFPPSPTHICSSGQSMSKMWRIA